MRRLNRLAVASSLGALLAVGAASSAQAGNDATCVGTLPPGTYGNVTVPTGADCFLTTAHVVEGNVKVERNAGLRTSGTRIEKGNVETDGGRRVQLRSGTFVGGNVVIKNVPAIPTEAPIQICESTVRENVQLESNRARYWIGAPGFGCGVNQRIGGDVKSEKNVTSGPVWNTIEGQEVGGNVQVFENRELSSFTSVSIQGNRPIRGNLQCDKNTPAPTGGGNIVLGNRQGQCAAF